MHNATPAGWQPRSPSLSQPVSSSRTSPFRPDRPLPFYSYRESDDLSKKCLADSPATWHERKTRANSDSSTLKRTANPPIALRSLRRDARRSLAAVFDADEAVLISIVYWILFCHLTCILHCRRQGRRDDLNRITDQVIPGQCALSPEHDIWTASYKTGRSPVLRCGDKQQTHPRIDRLFGQHLAPPVESVLPADQHPLIPTESFTLPDSPASDLHVLEEPDALYNNLFIKHIRHLAWTFHAWLGRFNPALREWIQFWLTWTYICIATAYPYAGRTYAGHGHHGGQPSWQQPTSYHPSYQLTESTVAEAGKSGGNTRKPSGNGSDRGPPGDPPYPNPSFDSPEDARWCHCVYHRVNGDESNDPFQDCRTLKKYVSNMTVHNERHGLFYCLDCWECFESKDDCKAHANNNSCGPKPCVHGGLFGVGHDCYNYNQDPPYTDRPCAHEKRLDQTYKWAKIFRLAHDCGPHDHVRLPLRAPRPLAVGSQPMVLSQTAPPRIPDDRNLRQLNARDQAALPSESASADFQPPQGLSDRVLSRSDLPDSAEVGFNRWADLLRHFIGNLWEMCNQPEPRLIQTHLQYLNILAPDPEPVLAGPQQVLTLVNFPRLLARSMVDIIVDPIRQTQDEWRLLRAMVNTVLTPEEFGNPPQQAPWIAAYIYQDATALNNMTGGEAYRAQNDVGVNPGVPLNGYDVPPDPATGLFTGPQPNTTEQLRTHPHGNNHELVNDSMGQDDVALNRYAQYQPKTRHSPHNPSSAFPPPLVRQNMVSAPWTPMTPSGPPNTTPPETQPLPSQTGSLPQARSVNATSPPYNRPAPSMTRSATHVPGYHPYAHPDHHHRRASQRPVRRPSQIPLPPSDWSAVTTNLSSDPLDPAYSPGYAGPSAGSE